MFVACIICMFTCVNILNLFVFVFSIVYLCTLTYCNPFFNYLFLNYFISSTDLEGVRFDTNFWKLLTLVEFQQPCTKKSWLWNSSKFLQSKCRQSNLWIKSKYGGQWSENNGPAANKATQWYQKLFVLRMCALSASTNNVLLVLCHSILLDNL